MGAGGGHTADSETVLRLRQYAAARDKDVGFATGLTDTMRDAAARLEAAANRAYDEVELRRIHAERVATCREARLAAEAELDAAVMEATFHLKGRIAAEAERDAALAALRQALDCKGSYNGTVSERGGDPAICTKCEAVARAVLGGPE